MKQIDSFDLGICKIIPSEFAIQFEQEEKKSIQPKFIEVLCYLAQHHPRVIPRDELIDNIWVGNSYVGEKALTNAVWHLRQALKGANEDSESIETIRKVGYRLLIEPKWQKEADETKANNSTNPPPLKHDNIAKKITMARYPIAAILTLFIIILYLREVSQEEVFSLPVITQITKQPGSELFASPSPDGRQVVFKWEGKKSQDNLYLKDRNNPQLAPKQLTFGKASVGHSVWSNDGKYLYFTRKDKKLNICQVIQMKVLTSQEKPLIDCPMTGGYYYLDISPDDKTLAFHGHKAPADDSGIYFLDLADLKAQPFRFSCSNNCGYKDRDFAFSPDGEHIAVTRRVNRFSENVHLVNIATKESTQLSKGHEDIVGLNWHPNSEKLVYAAQRADNRNGYVIDINSKKTTSLEIEGFSYPAFSKKTGELFYQQRSEKYHIGSLQLDEDVASTPFPVIESDYSHHYPDYSSVNKKIVYVSNESGFYELWLMDETGGEREQITFLQQTVRYPRWSRDGSKIAFVAPVADEKADKVYIYNLVNKNLSIVPSEHTRHGRPTWSFDQKSIISSIRSNEFTDLFKIDIATGLSERISFDGGRFAIMTSDTTMLYTREKRGLWQKDIDDKKAQPLNKISGKVFRMIYSWDLFEDTVYFRKNFSSHHKLASYHLPTQTQELLLKLPLRSLGTTTALSYDNEHNKLFFTHAEFPQADIKSVIHPLINN